MGSLIMTTVRTIIDSSLRLIGVTKSTPQQYKDALYALNTMLSNWNTDVNMIPNKVRTVYNLVPNYSVFTLGPSGFFTADQAPVKVEAAAFIDSSLGDDEFDLTVNNDEAGIELTPASLTSTHPTDLIVSYTFPDVTLTLWPVPTKTLQLVLYTWATFTVYSDLTDVFDLPTGWESAVRYALALELAPEYGREPSQFVITEAIRSKLAVRRYCIRTEDIQAPFVGTSTRNTNIASRTHGLVVDE